MRGFIAAWLPRDAGEARLALAGAGLSLLGVIVVRYAAPAFRHPELAVLTFAAAYFGGMSLGYSVAFGRITSAARGNLPLLLLLQIAVLILLRPCHVLLSEVSTIAMRPLGLAGWVLELPAASAAVVVLATLVTPVPASLLPRAVALERRPLRRIYSVEVAGAVAGLAVAPALGLLGHEALLLAYCAVMITLAWCSGDRRPWSALAGAAAVVVAAVQGPVDARISAWCLGRTHGWSGAQVVHARHSPYQKVEVVEVAGVPRLVLDGRRQFGGDPARTYAYFAAGYPAGLLTRPRVAVLGCGSMATVGVIGAGAEAVEIVDIDEEVFAASRAFFQDYNRLGALSNWSFRADDAKHFLASPGPSYDLIVHDIMPARSRQLALTYTREFLELARARLTPGGVFSISCLSPVDGEGAYGRRLLATLAAVFETRFALQRGSALYIYGGGPRLVEPAAADALGRLPPDRAAGVRFLSRGDLDRMGAGAEVVTVGNVGALVYD